MDGQYIYFFVYYPRNQAENSSEIVLKNIDKKVEKCEWIFSRPTYDNDGDKKYINYKKIIKVPKSKAKKAKYYFEFELDDDNYIISFEGKGRTFIYNVKLEVGKRILPIKTTVDQSVIEYNEIIDYFTEAIESNEDKDKKDKIINELLKDSIELYKKEKGFGFLISLFLKVYKSEDLCNALLKTFREMNETSPDEKNKEKKDFLREYTSKFESIAYDAEEIIKNNKYNAVDFYGIILSYLNYYDFKKFSEIVNALSDKKPEELYDILLIYHSHFINTIKKYSDFFDKFIKYVIEKHDYSKYKIALNYIKDIKIFLEIIDKNKENIYNKYISSVNNPKKNEEYIIKIDKSFRFKNEEEKAISSQHINELENKIESSDREKKEIPSIIGNINSIVKFSDEKAIFLIFFNSDFWEYILRFCKKPILDNILNCSNLRKSFFQYHNLVKKIVPKKDKLKIYNDANNIYEIDEFANLLDQIIKKYINNHKEIPDIEKLSFLTTYHPYYQRKKGSKYINKAETDILDLFDLDKINEEFIGFFRDMNFEDIFDSNIHEYISKITSKIKNISNFENIIKLINFKNIELKNIILNSLNNYYEKIIVKNIITLKGEKLNEAIEVTAIISILNFIYEQQKDINKKLEFIKNIIKRYNEKLKPLIMIDVIKICIDKKFRDKLYLEMDITDINDMKNFVFEQFSNKIRNYIDIQNIIKLIKCIEKTAGKEQKYEIINEFLAKLMEKNLFTKEEFFLNKPNPKIKLLCELNKEGIIQKNDEDYYDNIKKLIISINNDITNLNIRKKQLENFLKIDEALIKQRLSLIKIISDNSASPDEKLEQLKKKNNDINEDFEKFKYIYNNIRLYYKSDYKDIINKLFNIINDTENKEISQYKGGGKTRELMKECDNASLYNKAKKIEKVQDFLLFNVIYEMNTGINDETSFNQAYDKYEKIRDFLKDNSDKTDINKLYEDNKKSFDKIREYLSIEEQEAQKFIDNLKQHFGITNEKLIDDLNILFKSKKYELEINSIIFFFQFFENENTDWNNKIPETYKNLSEKDFTDIKSILLALKNNKIYDYKNENNFSCRLFKCLYEQKEAIDFIFEKINQNKQNINALKNKIPPTSKTINENDITSTQECIFHFNKMKNKKNNFQRLEYINSLTENEIKQFENYSKIFNAVIELDRSDEFSDDVYEQVNSKIEQDLTLNILQDSENFIYFSKSKGQYEKITMKELLDLKNKIPNENIINNKDTQNESDQNDELKDKRKTLFFFKNLINDLEIINKYMKVLREKGCSLPIKICIKVNKDNISYFLEDKEVKVKTIKEFLLKVKNLYIPQLNSIYKLIANLRFLYGKQFRSMMKHIEKSYNLDSFLRYILNIKDNDIVIIEGDKGINRKAKDYISLPEIYSQNSFEAISNYITDLFKKNNKPMETHYNNIKITPVDVYKGIYLQKCDKDNPMENFIINLFWDKLTELPIAQNILITSKETSIEEIQSFLHRAILCNYNTLFVVEINESFSEYQQNIMNSYIDQLLSYKNTKYNEGANEKVDKKYTQKYMDSCLTFIYDVDNSKKITSFLKELNNVEEQKFDDISKNINEKVKEQILKQLGNIKVITSDICGLGKSGKIKKEIINESKKKYFHFPLGGILTKNVIFDKLNNLLNKIKNYNFKDVAIHLDLTESKEKSVINEFLFSFLVTKFYANNENIIYIPNNIDIYVEIPNCFESYISKFNILNIFNKENITFQNMPEFDYPKEIIDIFHNMLGYNSNAEIQEFVKEYIGIDKYSFTQINIFIKIFISQFNKSGIKFSFTSKGENLVSKDFIKQFTPCTKYFTDGGFAKLLTNEYNNKNDKEDYIDKLSNSFDDDVHRDLETPFLFINKEKREYKVYIPSNNSNEFKNSKYYLRLLKDILDIPNEVEETVGDKKSLLSIIEEKDNNYVITNDNFNKMVLLIYRIKANVPVIIMGDTGCGKTALITKLNQLLNNGETTIQIINIHPGINDEELCGIMKNADEMAKKQSDKELWLFFDEINTCLSLSLITEIFINRTYNGNNFSNNIRLIGACNPYRRRKGNKEKCGLSLSEDNKDELVYLVEPLPQSLLYYVFSFGSINAEDEKRYIYNIIEKLFTEEEKDLHLATTEAISQCHIYLRKTFDSSVVSLREITRFVKCVEFFKEYFTKKNNNYFAKKNVCEKRINNEKNNKIRSIICSIYLCYYIRLIDEKKRTNFDVELRKTLFKLVNTKEESERLNLLKKIMRIDMMEKEDDNKITNEERTIINEILAIELTEKERKSIEEKNESKKSTKRGEKNKIEKEKDYEEKNKIEIIKLSQKELEIATQNMKNKDNNEELTPDEKEKRIKLLKEIKIKYKKYYEEMDETKGTVDQFKDKDFKNEINSRPNEVIDQFSDFIKIEQNYLIEQIDLDKGIGKNTLLKENLFLLFVSVNTNIPLIIIGKPGSGKSLSAQLIYKSMKGIYSKNKFFKLFPRIIQTYFQGSKSTDSKDVETLFTRAGRKLNYYKKKREENKNEKLPISMILFDELGLAELSESNPLKVLHSKLEYGGKEEGVSFIGISNYTLDAAKINRALVLSVPDLDQKIDEIIETSKNIVESIYPSIKDDNIFEILSNTYFEYKNTLQLIKELIVYKQYKTSSSTNKDKDALTVTSETNEQLDTNIDEFNKNENNKREKRQFSDIKEDDKYKELLKQEAKIRKDFHGNRDFYHLIQGTAYDLGKVLDSRDSEKIKIIIKYIERNFGGIDYEIDIDFNLVLDDIQQKIDTIHEILKAYNHKEGKIIKLKSVYLFKAIYNIQCDKIEQNSPLKIDIDIINDYDLNKSINDNIRDNNSRYLLLEVKQSLTTLIYQNIRLQNENIIKDEIELHDGSPFVDDENKEYKFKKINEIQEDAKKDKLIIIENLNQIHPFLFDLYNRNFQIINGKKFARICLDNFDEQLTEVFSGFRIIILVDKRFVNKCDLAFLNRFEKHILSFDQLLDPRLKNISRKLISDIKLRQTINLYENANYSLKNLLINCENEEIQGLNYYFSKEGKKDGKETENNESKDEQISEEMIRENAINKIYKILPQDIIAILPEENIVRKHYFDFKNIINFNNYIESGEYKKYKVSIIYTFTTSVEGLASGMSFLISEMKSENDFKTKIDEIKTYSKTSEDQYICIHFDQSNAKNIKFISNLLTKIQNGYKYIIIIHINRNFNKNINDKIYSLPDINPDINQIFIDNLNDNNTILLRDILKNELQNLLKEKRDQLKLDEEFDKTLKNFLKKELNENAVFIENKIEYITDVISYMDKDKDDFLRNKIIELTYKMIDEMFKNNETFQDIIEKIYSKFINKFTLDIVSCLIEYIKEEIFNKYLRKIFELIEDNNILTTLIDIKKRKFKTIKSSQVKEILEKYLNSLVFNENKKYKCKFLYNFNVPGFYNFFKSIQEYIKKNITSNYFNNEKILRELQADDITKKNTFQETEEFLLNNVFNEIINNYKFYYDMLNNPNLINVDLVFDDYITYYLQEYINKYDIYNNEDIYHKILILLLKFRFDNENIIIKSGDIVKILLIKIIWLESNVYYVKNVIKLIKSAKKIFNEDNILYKVIDETIFDKEKKLKINYITNKKRNPEITKEVNQCYYIILACICYIITSEEIQLINNFDDNNKNEIKIEIHDYIPVLKEINNILQSINDDLRVFLNEMYIVDELIKVFEIFKENINIERINSIKNKIRENALIIQKYFNDDSKLSNELIDNFKIIYKLIVDNEDIKIKDKNYYDNLRYIYYKEIRKVSLVDYRFEVIEKLLEEDEIIKKSNEIFQMVLKEYLKKEDKFKDNKKKILSGNDRIIALIESQINLKNVLAETLLYLFEKNSLIYYDILKNQKEPKYLDDDPLNIFIDSVNYLVDYSEKKLKKEDKNKEFCKLFCIGYIKTFCFIFIKMFDAKEPKWKLPDKVINVINGNNNVCKMIRLYIYKILYNEYSVDFFYNKDNIQKFKLVEYKDFAEFIQNQELNNIYKIDYRVPTINNEKFDASYRAIEKSKKNKFNDKITKIQFNIEEFGIDNFYIASYNSTLSYLQTESSEINENFYKNICQPLFKEKKTLLKALELFYEPQKIKEIIKLKYKINSKSIKPFLFGYRYCINQLWNENSRGIYYPLYDGKNINYLKDKLYPGNDTKSNPVYSDVINHFKIKPKEGCYVCLCAQGYYHSVPSGFPGKKYLKRTCPKCYKNIGTESGWTVSFKLVKRNNYYRIFKDENEIKELKKDENKKKKLEEIYFMTLKEFKEKYIVKTNENEKGVFKTDENSFKSDNKIIRNLSQISYRLLNYILYIHLFFARVITEKNDFDKYLPEKMTWVKTISECWKLLEEELKKVGIVSIDEFLHYIFAELFPILNKEKTIDNYKNLYKFEEQLEEKIQELIYKFKLDGNSLELYNNEKDNDKNSTINLLKEKYTKEYYKDDEFPFYNFFYFSNYLNEKHLKEKLAIYRIRKYPVLSTYLDFKLDNKGDINKNLLDNLHLFNNTLNIISQKYFNNISREYAEKTKLKDDDIYKNNKTLFDNFIKFYNNLELKELQSKRSLNTNNVLMDFFIDDNSEYGKSYKIIYKAFIKKQNEKLENLLDEKISKEIFDNNCKNRINIQQIKEQEIFTLNLPKKISFIDILFNYSYRNALNTKNINYRAYNIYNINHEFIEEKMTELLLKNKKLLNEDNNTYITDFIYNNEVFNNKVTDLITTFKTKLVCKNIIPDDKVIIYKFCLGTINNFNFYKSIIKGFLSLINFLINYWKENTDEKNNKFKEDTQIYKVIEELKDPALGDIKKLFEGNDAFTINKTTDIFDYYLKSIFENISSDIKKYQDKDLDISRKETIDNYFKGEHIIKKVDFAYAIRLFISLVLFQEEDKDKDNKIKYNRNNIVNYLKSLDFWKSDFNEKFLKNLNELKLMNFQVNQIISLYEILGKDIENNYFDDVKQKIASENAVDPSQNVKSDDEGDDKQEDNEPEEKEEEEEVNDAEDLY